MRISLLSAILASFATITTATSPEPSQSVSRIDRRVTTSDTTALYPGGIGRPLDGPMGQITPVKTQNVSVANYLVNKIPARCKAVSLEKKADGVTPKCALANLEVVDIGFADAPGRLWSICCCTDSPVTYQQLADELRRVPVVMRQRARNFMLFNNQGTGIVAYAQGTDVVFYGTISPTVVWHEIGHTVDLNGKFSNTDVYKNAVAKDSCWADAYSRTSLAEAWTQVHLFVRYTFGSGTTVIRQLPTALFGAGLTRDCLSLQFYTIHWLTVEDHIAGYNPANNLTPDTLVNRL